MIKPKPFQFIPAFLLFAQLLFADMNSQTWSIRSASINSGGLAQHSVSCQSSGTLGLPAAAIQMQGESVNMTSGFQVTCVTNLMSAVENKDQTTFDALPTEFSISQNYPNPFNSRTRIQYSVIEPVQVQLIIFNTLGQIVTRLVHEHQSPGVYTVNWNAGTQSLKSGVYFCRIQAGEFTAVRKMLHVK